MQLKKIRFSFVFIAVAACALIIKFIASTAIPVQIINEDYNCEITHCLYSVTLENQSNFKQVGKLRVIGDLKKPLKMISMSGVYAGDKLEEFSLQPNEQVEIQGNVTFKEEVSTIRFVIMNES